MPRVILAITIIAIWIYGIIDCARSPKDSMPGRLPKSVWIIVTLIPVVGALLWLILSWPIKHPNGFGTIEVGRGRPRKPEPEGPIAPDDDPEFLAKLDARNRFAEWERQQAKASAEPTGDEAKPTDNQANPTGGQNNPVDNQAKPTGGQSRSTVGEVNKNGDASNFDKVSDAKGASSSDTVGESNRPSKINDPLASELDNLDAELRKFLDDEGSQSA
jgi:hypothetical protein